MREDNRRNDVPIFFQEIEVRDANVYAVNALFRKSHPGVNDNHVFAVTYGHTVHPKLADAAEWDQF
jgi:hypothetical protein